VCSNYRLRKHRAMVACEQRQSPQGTQARRGPGQGEGPAAHSDKLPPAVRRCPTRIRTGTVRGTFHCNSNALSAINGAMIASKKSRIHKGKPRKSTAHE